MHKVLVIGCGGSGAKTLSHMMERLKRDLAEQAPEWWRSHERLPSGWKFISIDAPAVADFEGTLPSVDKAGGQHIACGTPTGLRRVRTDIADKAGEDAQLGRLASWALQDQALDVLPTDFGAGQYRGVGRMLTLHKLEELNKHLRMAWSELAGTSTDDDLKRIARELGQSETVGGPVVFIVASMAGGMGASAAIDVSRLVTNLPAVKTSSVNLFLITPDMFFKGNTPEGDWAMTGANPNALAMFAELFSAQVGAGVNEDAELYRALGVQSLIESPLVGRVVPVVPPGGASPSDAYHFVGASLAAHVMDASAMSSFIEHLGQPDDTQLHGFGWGVTNHNAIQWATYGHSRLTMGRDRYAEYAAQRIARRAEEILAGRYHSDSEEITQARTRFGRQLAEVMPVGNDAVRWTEAKWGEYIDAWSMPLLQDLLSKVHLWGPVPSKVWLQRIDNQLAERSRLLWEGLHRAQISERPFYAAMRDWAGPNYLQKAVLEAVDEVVGLYGAAGAAALLHDLRDHLTQQAIPQLAGAAEGLPVSIDYSVWQRIRDQEYVSQYDDTNWVSLVNEEMRRGLRRVAVGYIARQSAEVLIAFDEEFLHPLEAELKDRNSQLRRELTEHNPREERVSGYVTERPMLWPSEEDGGVPPERFASRSNEVSLTDVAEFQERFAEHIEKEGGLDAAAEAVAAGEGLLALRTGKWWLPPLFAFDPSTGQPHTPQRPRFDIGVLPHDVLLRSRRYVQRQGSMFGGYVSESLSDYAAATGLPEEEGHKRRAMIAEKFREALTMAQPAAPVNEELLAAITDTVSEPEVSFSCIPFQGKELELLLGEQLSPAEAAAFEEAMCPASDVRHIYITTTRKAPPIAFRSVLEGAARQWDEADSDAERSGFWTMRRARPLPAALAMSEFERRAMIRGWFIGTITGRVDFPIPDEDGKAFGRSEAIGPIKVLDPRPDSPTEGQWLNFGLPPLTRSHQVRQPRNYLPAMLVTMSLAWAQAGDAPVMASVQPYFALRALWDDADVPTEFIAGREGLSGQRILKEWLLTGERPAGDSLTVDGTGPDVSVEERYAGLMNYLERERERYRQYSPSGVTTRTSFLGFEAPREFGDVRDPDVASRLPLFADLAEDCVAAIDDVMACLEWALDSSE